MGFMRIVAKRVLPREAARERNVDVRASGKAGKVFAVDADQFEGADIDRLFGFASNANFKR
jgi:hypothetical protein